MPGKALVMVLFENGITVLQAVWCVKCGALSSMECTTLHFVHCIDVYVGLGTTPPLKGSDSD